LSPGHMNTQFNVRTRAVRIPENLMKKCRNKTTDIWHQLVAAGTH